VLNKDGFEQGLSKKINIQSKDVGDLQRIKVYKLINFSFFLMGSKIFDVNV